MKSGQHFRLCDKRDLDITMATKMRDGGARGFGLGNPFMALCVSVCVFECVCVWWCVRSWRVFIVIFMSLVFMAGILLGVTTTAIL